MSHKCLVIKGMLIAGIEKGRLYSKLIFISILEFLKKKKVYGSIMVIFRLKTF